MSEKLLAETCPACTARLVGNVFGSERICSKCHVEYLRLGGKLVRLPDRVTSAIARQRDGDH